MIGPDRLRIEEIYSSVCLPACNSLTSGGEELSGLDRCRRTDVRETGRGGGGGGGSAVRTARSVGTRLHHGTDSTQGTVRGLGLAGRFTGAETDIGIQAMQ